MAKKKQKAQEWRIVSPPSIPGGPPFILVVDAVSKADAIRQYNEAAKQSGGFLAAFDPEVHQVGRWSALEALTKFRAHFGHDDDAGGMDGIVDIGNMDV